MMSHVSANASADSVQFVKSLIRTVPDWPQAGVQFRDITPLIGDAKGLRVLIDLFVERYVDAKLDYVAGLDARGFIIGPIVAYELGVGFIPIRKIGKLPYRTVSETYKLEYGESTVEIHEDACHKDARVVIVDDLIATGGTMLAGKLLLERIGARVVEGAAIIDLPDLGGSKLLTDAGLPLFTITSFGGH